MAKGKWVEDRFRKQLYEERKRLHWSQETLAAKLSASGTAMHWTTVAKIEKGTRSVRIDEAAALADLFGISVDALLQRGARPDSDRAHALIAVADTAVGSSGQIRGIISAIRDRIGDLSTFGGLPTHSTLIAGCERVCDLLVDADDVLSDVDQVAREGIGKELRTK
jgi:transcriptional regulator with XRE-family HTH domain